VDEPHPDGERKAMVLSHPHEVAYKTHAIINACRIEMKTLVFICKDLESCCRSAMASVSQL
jgi:hypothetical protein